MKPQTKLLVLAAVLLPGGLLFLLIPLMKAIWRHCGMGAGTRTGEHEVSVP